MAYQFNFGGLTVAGSAPVPKKGRKFRLAVLGDFSSRANRGELETGEALSSRKPLTVAADNLDDLLERLSPTLQLALPGSGTVALTFASMEDFHPDALYEKLEIFSQLSGLRQRLKSSSTFAKAAKEMRDIGLALAPPPAEATPAAARGSVLAVNMEISDFARFLGQPTADPDVGEDAQTSLNAFLRGIVAPYVSPTKDPQQDKLVAAADAAIGAMMRAVLHHPDFQGLESLWRSLAFLATRVETDETLQIVLIDLSAEEFAADLSAGDQLQETALYRILAEKPLEDANAGPFSAVVANYVFERTPTHADLLGRVAMIASAAQAPFIASVPAHALDVKPADLDPLTRDAWNALRALPEAAYLGLALPRFLLRLPYGPKTEPIESFKFEEFNVQAGPGALLWANPAVAVGLLLSETFRQQGDQMQVGSISGIGELPYVCYEDADGDETALPCTERLLTATAQEFISGEGFLPLLALKNSPEMRVGIFRAVGGGLLWGWWSGPLPATSAPAAPEATAEAEAPAVEAALPDPASTEAAPAGDPELDALLAGLDTPAAEPPADAAPVEAAPAEPPASDPELDAMLAALEAPAEPSPVADSGSADPVPAEAAAELAPTEPAETTPPADAPPESDPELEAMLNSLLSITPSEDPAADTAVAEAPADSTPTENPAEAAAVEEPPPIDPELDAMLAALHPIEAPAENPAESIPVGPSADSTPVEPPASDPELDAMLAALQPLAAPVEPEPMEPLAESVPESAPTSDPELDAMLADLLPVETPPEPTPADASEESQPATEAVASSEEGDPALASPDSPANSSPTTAGYDADAELAKLLADLS